MQSSQSKLEKADILEMTVKHLRNTQRLQRQLSQCTIKLYFVLLITCVEWDVKHFPDAQTTTVNPLLYPYVYFVLFDFD